MSVVSCGPYRDGVAFTTTADRAKLINLHRNPKCSLLVSQDDWWGYLVLEGFLSPAWRTRLRAAMDDLAERGRAPGGAGPDFEFEQAPEWPTPRLRQVLCAADHHEDVWAYASGPPLTDLVADLDNYLIGRPTRAGVRDSALYRARRIAAYVIRAHPTPVGGAIVALTMALLMMTFWGIGAGALIGPQPSGNEVALIGFLDSTYEALRHGVIGKDIARLEFTNRKSWRLLHGRLMQRLAVAEPRVVVWDYYLPDPQPQYDPAFVAGVRSLNSPVVVGVKSFDKNPRPTLSAEIGDAIHAYGALHTDNPGAFRDEIDIAVCIQRGFEPPIPSLCLAAYGAYRFPDCDVVAAPEGQSLQLRYRKRQPAPTDARWREETDPIALSKTHVSRGGPWTQPGDRISHARFRLRTGVSGGRGAIPYEDVLGADDDQLRAWFAGRAVVIGDMFARSDRHKLATGEWIYGCEIQAQVLEAMIAGSRQVPFTRAQIASRTAAWCLLAALLIVLTPLKRLRPAMRQTVILTMGMSFGGLALAAYSAARIRSWPEIEMWIAASALLTTGSLMFLAAASRQRQLRLSPDLTAPPHVTGDSTTLPASPRRSGGSSGATASR